jgi:hypothetical protein
MNRDPSTVAVRRSRRGISGAELKHPPRALFVDLMKATGVSTLVVFVDELTVVRHVMR